MLREFKMCTSQMLLLYVFFPCPSCGNREKELAVFLNKYNILSALPFPNKTLIQRHVSLVTHSSPFTGSPPSPGHNTSVIDPASACACVLSCYWHGSTVSLTLQHVFLASSSAWDFFALCLMCSSHRQLTKVAFWTIHGGRNG